MPKLYNRGVGGARIVAEVDPTVPDDDDQFRFRCCVEFMELCRAKVLSAQFNSK